MANLDIYAPFDDGPGANVTEDTWRKMMRHINGSASGVVRGFQEQMEVYADDSGMQVKVKTGECLMRGHFGSNDSEKTLPIAAAHGSNPRIDRVVIRADFLNNVISLEVLTGTAASSPQPPAVTQNSTVWETTLAQVYVPANDGSIESNQITDERVFTTAHSKYVRRGGTGSRQIFRSGVYSLVAPSTPIYRTADIESTPEPTRVTNDEWPTKSGQGYQTFKLNRAGLWTITARLWWDVNSGGARELFIADMDDFSPDGSGRPTNIYGAQSAPGLNSIHTHQSCTATERFAAGQEIVVVGFQNGTGTNTDLTLLASDITFTWIGP